MFENKSHVGTFCPNSTSKFCGIVIKKV